MLCLVGVNGMERMKLEEINENWIEDWEKMKQCKIVMIRILKKMDVVRNEAFHLKLGHLNYSQVVRNGMGRRMKI